MTKGIRVASTGHKVSDDKQFLALDSTLPGSLKVAETFQMTIVSNGTSGHSMQYTNSQFHGLGYVPYHLGLVYVVGEQITYLLPWYSSTLRSLKVYCDDQFVYASADSQESNNYIFTVMIFAEGIVN